MRDVGRYWKIPGIGSIFMVFGIVSIVSGVFAPNPRHVLIAFGATGLFASILVYFVTPKYFVRASIVERIHDVLAANAALLVPGVEQHSTYTYLPRDGKEPGNGSVFLFIPHTDDAESKETNLDDQQPFPQSDECNSGTVLCATGDALLAEFDDKLVMDLSNSPLELSRQIADGLKNGLELAETVSYTIDPSEKRATIEIERPIIESVGQFDDPITSFIGSAFAFGLGQSVTVETTENDNGEITISCLWQDLDDVEKGQHELHSHSVSSQSTDH